MHDLEHVVSLVPPSHVLDDDVARLWPDAAGRLEHPLKRRTGPLADRRPALLADVGRDLRARRQALDLVERERPRTLDEARHRQSPVPETLSPVALILRVARVGLVPGREGVRDVGASDTPAPIADAASSSRFVPIVSTSAVPTSPPRTRVERRSRANTLSGARHRAPGRSPARCGVRCAYSSLFLREQVYLPVTIERTRLSNPAAATSARGR